MIQKTKDYDMFIFRDDNKDRIRWSHVEAVRDSIKSKNLLEFRPICVNTQMEIIDGQHRLLAAKELGVDIYYMVKDSFEATDIILLNVCKDWSNTDYLNFYVQNKYPEYVKLDHFLKTNQITLVIAMALMIGRGRVNTHSFRKGLFKMSEKNYEKDMELCKRTIDVINKENGIANSLYTMTTRFWLALIGLIRHPDFEEKVWFKKLDMMVSRFGPRVSKNDFLSMLSKVYNHHSHTPIEFKVLKE